MICDDPEEVLSDAMTAARQKHALAIFDYVNGEDLWTLTAMVQAREEAKAAYAAYDDWIDSFAVGAKTS